MRRRRQYYGRCRRMNRDNLIDEFLTKHIDRTDFLVKEPKRQKIKQRKRNRRGIY